MKIIFATHNKNKALELQKLMPTGIEIVTLEEVGCFEEIPETGKTLEENAILKARYVYDKFQLSCFADDTGLEIEALNGEPGVYSARYAGLAKNDDLNMNMVLDKLKGQENRAAQFRTVIALFWKGKLHTFEGIVEGKMGEIKKGNQGFGYDPIFIPEDQPLTFAEMDIVTKNKMSHRARATHQMLTFIQNHLAE